MNLIRSVLPHILIIISGIFIVFLILDSYNPTMEFVSNPISTKLFWAFCILSIINGVLTIVSNRSKWRNKE
ncbi:hypothetical protein [Anaeromicropila herbilytica]|uniref:Uncharacterized protein n=1 Tax=Anaeromicropila herbilytica TaxID=2785025 RepID=A0A7R7EPV6_9FIRM|nr:hypothetical protein [Anaeromicropila herbilytica]BCN32880.1 hypothetical protein bsdtb5_41750 [Anaeromicropila herbilytica]